MEKLEFEQILKRCAVSNDKRIILEGAKLVAESGNPYYICDFVENVAGADTLEVMSVLQSAMERTNDYVHIYEFAFLTCDMGLKSVNFNSLFNKLKESKNSKLLVYSAEYVPAFDKVEIAKALIEFGNAKWLAHYLESDEVLAGVDQDLKAELLEGIKQRYEEVKNVVHIPECVRHRGLKNVDEIIEYALNSKDPYVVNEVAEYLGEFIEDKSEFEDKIISLKDILHTYEFGASVPNVDVSKIENASIESGMPKYMYYVGAYVPDADAEKMLKSIKQSGNQKYIQMMEEHIEEINYQP